MLSKLGWMPKLTVCVGDLAMRRALKKKKDIIHIRIGKTDNKTSCNTLKEWISFKKKKKKKTSNPKINSRDGFTYKTLQQSTGSQKQVEQSRCHQWTCHFSLSFLCHEAVSLESCQGEETFIWVILSHSSFQNKNNTIIQIKVTDLFLVTYNLHQLWPHEETAASLSSTLT